MAGKRMLHKNICFSEKLSQISYMSECLYYRIMSNVDDHGRFFANPHTLKDACFPLRKISIGNIERCLDELQNVGLINRYSVNNVKYLEIVKFSDFQILRKDRPLHEICPSPTIGKPLVNQAETIGKPEVKVKVEVKDKVEVEGNGNQYHPTLEEIKSYISERGNRINPETFFNYYSANGWRVGRNPMKDWRAAIRHWESKEKSHLGVMDKSHLTHQRIMETAGKLEALKGIKV